MGRAILLLALLSVWATAQQLPPPLSQQISSLHEQVQSLAQGGQLAATHGATAVMRRYGERMARDYTRFDQELLNRAGDLGMHLPASTVPPGFSTGGSDFDRSFLAWAATRTQQLLNALRTGQRAAGPLAGLAGSLLPLVEVHRQLNLALRQPGAPV
jgi:predicted outer membrane protein